MAAKVIDIVAVINGESSKALLQQYYDLRARCFNERYGEGFYKPEADIYDHRGNALFILAVGEGRVMGGFRLLFHEPNSDIKLRYEENVEGHSIAGLLPHLDTRAMRYAEMSGIVVDPDMRRQGVSSLLKAEAFRMVKTGKIKVDFLVGYLMPDNVVPALKAAINSDMHCRVREAMLSYNGIDHVQVLYAADKNFPLDAPGTKNVSPREYLESNRLGANNARDC